MTSEIWLRTGERFIVDDDDFYFLKNMKWCVTHGGCGQPYAMNSKRQLLHRVITNAPKGMPVDHINGNTLDNRKCNLRVCSRSQNAQNSRIHKNNKTGYKGVTKHHHRFRVDIACNGTNEYIGLFKTAEEAAQAYNEEAIKRHGEFARLNIIPES